MEEKEKTIMIAVPERWFKSLLQHAIELDGVHKEYEFGNYKNDKIFNKAVALMGYARSAQSILDHNERVEKI
jgi:hypothetical protein